MELVLAIAPGTTWRLHFGPSPPAPPCGAVELQRSRFQRHRPATYRQHHSPNTNNTGHLVRITKPRRELLVYTWPLFFPPQPSFSYLFSHGRLQASCPTGRPRLRRKSVKQLSSSVSMLIHYVMHRSRPSVSQHPKPFCLPPVTAAFGYGDRRLIPPRHSKPQSRAKPPNSSTPSPTSGPRKPTRMDSLPPAARIPSSKSSNHKLPPATMLSDS